MSLLAQLFPVCSFVQLYCTVETSDVRERGVPQSQTKPNKEARGPQGPGERYNYNYNSRTARTRAVLAAAHALPRPVCH